MTRPRRERQGSTLLEVLFAVFLVAVCATILAASMPTATRSQKIADLNNKATNLAQKELEAIRALGYANLTPAQLANAQLIDSTTPVSANTYAFTNVDGGVTDSVAQMLPSGTGTVLIEQIDLDLRRVTIAVNYTYRGTAKSVRMGSLVANL